jgi:hypothetical protein
MMARAIRVEQMGGRAVDREADPVAARDAGRMIAVCSSEPSSSRTRAGPDPSTRVTGRIAIAGEPTKRATKTLAGRA